MVNNLQRINSVLNGVYTFGMQNYNYFLRRKSYDGLFFKKYVECSVFLFVDNNCRAYMITLSYAKICRSDGK